MADRLDIPAPLVETRRRTPEGVAWLKQLPEVVGEMTRRWSLTLDPPFGDDEMSAAWVAPVRRSDGTSAVLKVGFPHMEAEHEIDGLRFWDGNPTVRLLDADDAALAMLLERCEPGSKLRALPEPDQDEVIASLLRRLWRRPPVTHPFRPLSDMIASWSEETMRYRAKWPDRGLVEAGLQLFEELSRTTQDVDEVLLATDLHAGNVLRAQREPWLVVDPKPFVGDSAYDATQHLFNCEARLRADPRRTIGRFADLLEVRPERVLAWTFARASAEPRDQWRAGSTDLARMLAPMLS